MSVQTVEKVADLKANRKTANYLEHAETILKGLFVAFEVLLVLSSATGFYQLKEKGCLNKKIGCASDISSGKGVHFQPMFNLKGRGSSTPTFKMLWKEKKGRTTAETAVITFCAL